jgi:hypothetical protein
VAALALGENIRPHRGQQILPPQPDHIASAQPTAAQLRARTRHRDLVGEIHLRRGDASATAVDAPRGAAARPVERRTARPGPRARPRLQVIRAGRVTFRGAGRRVWRGARGSGVPPPAAAGVGGDRHRNPLMEWERSCRAVRSSHRV